MSNNLLEEKEDLVYRLKERARIRRQISTRKSVQEGAPDRIADLLEEAAAKIESLSTVHSPKKDVWDNEWDETRVDAIGQNGNEGLHYCLDNAYDDVTRGFEES